MSNDGNTEEELPIFYPPQVDLKHKVGSGGLSKETVKKAQIVINENKTDFRDVAAPYMSVLNDGISKAKKDASRSNSDVEIIIENILFPAMQLKANGEIFHYPIVTVIGDRLLKFLERINKVDKPSIEIVDAFEASINLIFKKELRGPLTNDGIEIIKELDAACKRFFEKYPDNIHPRFIEKQKGNKA